MEYVAHLDSGIQVIFYPNGEFSYEYDPYERERDAGLTFNSLASNYGSQRLGFWNRESEGQDQTLCMWTSEESTGNVSNKTL